MQNTPNCECLGQQSGMQLLANKHLYKHKRNAPNNEKIQYIHLGPLSAVTQFRRLTPNQVVYRWTPPPTLDLTDVSQDIVYSIEIYNITCGANDLLSSQYRLNISLYENALLDPQHVYKVVVVPRSNVQGAMNGTTFIEYGKSNT